MNIPFTKLHGAANDFLLTWENDSPSASLPGIARRICSRHTGVGADGWMLVAPSPNGLRTRLFNSDGSEAEISGNGTRCAAAFALVYGGVEGPDLTIVTGAGPKTLHLIERSATRFLFEMDMGLPKVEQLHATIELAGRSFDATILDIGNPQCALFVDAFPQDWLGVAAEAEAHPRFPRRSNVSLVVPSDRNSIDVRFFERGAGETNSSGTGSTGAATAAILRNVCASPVDVRTPAGSLHIRWDDSVFLTGPAEVIAEGSFFVEL